MYVTTSEQRTGLLVAVVSGGRPLLQQRPTAKFLPLLRDAGFGPVVWSVSDTDAPGYEQDGMELAVYPRAWAEEYAAAHWMNPEPPAPGGFLGAFPGREWACREAERRGCWGVLQLDDNITKLAFFRGSTASAQVVQRHGSMALFADLLAAVCLSTNARTVGANMTSVNPRLGQVSQMARAGFPYSLFIEQVGAGREEWYGPFEDDITHSLQYGDRPDGATAAIIPNLLYMKESRSGTGMRSRYDNTRSKDLQRLYPQGAHVGVRATKSNGRGEPRVFHTMPPGAVRNRLVVKDPALFGAARAKVQAILEEWTEMERAANRAKVHRRAGIIAPAPGSLPSEAQIAEDGSPP